MTDFARLSPANRIAHLIRTTRLTADQGAVLRHGADEASERLAENVVGAFAMPMGVVPGLVVDGTPVDVPLASEQSGVIAGVALGAGLTADGVATDADPPVMTAQIPLIDLPDPHHGRLKVLENRAEITATADAADPVLVRHGGGCRGLEARVIVTTAGTMLMVELHVDTGKAMGAGALRTMAQAAGRRLAALTGGRVLLGMVTNLADRRRVRARAVFRTEGLGGAATRDALLAAAALAHADPGRATTHNKGLLNAVTAVAVATGNDPRAIAAGAHAWAARDGRYRALSHWELTPDLELAGSVELPLALGVVGGATTIHPAARAALAITGVDDAVQLARIALAAGLVGHLGTLLAQVGGE